ncbi:hypothetical protein HY256_12090, partial [Candidatus Sumerlaeota bacterium]|nr:hypothetical protein [Candidatus Sumerlaeota bacterium]
MESLKEEIEKEDRETKDGCMLIRLNQYGNEQLFIQEVFQSEQFTRWQSGHGRLTFLLDGLDETPMGTLLMSTRILKELEAIQSAFDRLFLRITCRTAELPKSLRDGLANLWPSEQFRMYQLAPLVYRDVELAAIQSRLDPVKFMQEVHEKNAPSLASKPITLQFLLSIYLREGQFPTAWKDLFLKGCKYLGGEHNQYRQDLGVQRELSEDQVLSIAALIAAVVLFCNKPRITINEPPPDSGNVLPISEIVPSQVQANAETFTVGLAEMKEALHTGLFTKRDLNAFMFSHQTYAEFLAAWHLANSGIDAAQVGRLLR